MLAQIINYPTTTSHMTTTTTPPTTPRIQTQSQAHHWVLQELGEFLQLTIHSVSLIEHTSNGIKI